MPSFPPPSPTSPAAVAADRERFQCNRYLPFVGSGTEKLTSSSLSQSNRSSKRLTVLLCSSPSQLAGLIKPRDFRQASSCPLRSML
ncbi:hypothetical protein RRG08_026658 [Elysia crispata]|uniref:Uncharacterized protein n=1 Tax=Elysia crispata TaxID=231223 RepID=A0AAE1AYF1_9GAST|nr:hypothetical protein RRG08_026658 [Elysia crispata]